jgi:hypothetical protein
VWCVESVCDVWCGVTSGHKLSSSLLSNYTKTESCVSTFRHVYGDKSRNLQF